MLSDSAHLQFLTPPGARIESALATAPEPRLRIIGNRGGILALANALLWLSANDHRRELLALSELPCLAPGSVPVLFRLTDVALASHHGLVQSTQHGAGVEWLFGDEQVTKVALLLHRLASLPEHEYDSLYLEPESTYFVEVRQTDAADWL